MHPLFAGRWTVARHGRNLAHVAQFCLRERRAFIESVRAESAHAGPLRALPSSGKLSRARLLVGVERRQGGARVVVWVGDITTDGGASHLPGAGTDLTERALPGAVWPLPTARPCRRTTRELVRIAARALGVATSAICATTSAFRRGRQEPRVAELVGRGLLVPVVVEGGSRRRISTRSESPCRANRSQALTLRLRFVFARPGTPANGAPVRLPPLSPWRFYTPAQ